MNQDITMLLQDLGKEIAVDSIANYILLNPEVEDLLAAKMATMLSNQNDAHETIKSEQHPTTSSFGLATGKDTLLSRGRPSNIAESLLNSLSGFMTNYKMMFVVNMALNMGRGKQCAQVAHAAVGLCLDMKETASDEVLAKASQWLASGQKKIVVRADNLNHLLAIQKMAKEANLPSYLVCDAGCTQIPAGSRTVLAIFGSEQCLQPVTGSLRLL